MLLALLQQAIDYSHGKPRVGQFLKVESTEPKISSTLRILSFQLYFPDLGFL